MKSVRISMSGGPDHGRLYVLPQAPEWIGVLTLDDPHRPYVYVEDPAAMMPDGTLAFSLSSASAGRWAMALLRSLA